MITKQNQFDVNTVHLVESDFHAHRLWVCPDEHIAPAAIQSLQLAENDVFICLDSALSDEDKLRLSDHGNLKTI